MRSISIAMILAICSACGSPATPQDLALHDTASQKDADVRDHIRPEHRDGKVMIELAYDDGSVEENDSPWSNSPGGQIAVCFTAPSAQVTIASVRYYVTSMAKPQTVFGVRAYESSPGTGPGQEIALAAPITAAAVGGDEWVTVDLVRTVASSSKDFCLSMEWLTAPGLTGADAQFLGIDKSAPDARTWWKTGPTSWTKTANIGTGGDRDAMIRATVVQ